MRAGLLTEVLVFLEPTEKRGLSGAVSKEFKEVFRCRGDRRKMSLIADKDGVNAMEQFIGNTIVFQVRRYPIIKSSMRVEYLGSTYEIKMIDPQQDNTLLLTLNRINN